MAHLWTANDAGEWLPEPLDAEVVVLPGEQVAPGDRAVVIVRAPGPRAESWVLMAQPGADVRINGDAAAEGLRVLADRDEIVVRGRRCYFSTEQLARVVTCPARGTTLQCPRCRQAVEAGTEAVRCPQCGVWHHQSTALPCWTYADTCALCPQPTGLSTGYRWMPDPEER